MSHHLCSRLSLLAVLFLALSPGCASSKMMAPAAPPESVKDSGGTDLEPGQGAPGQMLIWRAGVSVEVGCVQSATEKVAAIAQKHGGHVESQYKGDNSAHLALRVPSARLKAAVADLDCVGSVGRTSISSEDVTEAYRDVDARLKNKVALRDRLRDLLTKAKDVKDILAIEKELARVQADIDVMQGRLKSMKGKVDMATLDVELERRQILGPLGFVLKYTFWSLGKLFVIQ